MNLSDFKITNLEIESARIKEVIDNDIKRKQLCKLIGNMATDELRLNHNTFFNKRKPTAEEIVNEVIKKDETIIIK